MEESKASKFIRMMRDQSSFKVGLIAKTTGWSSSFLNGLKTQKQENSLNDTREKLPALVQAINSARSASTSNTSVNSWASKLRKQINN